MKTLAQIGSGWSVPGIHDSERFFRHVDSLLPAQAILVLEESSMATDVVQFVSQHAQTAQVAIAHGTIWPRPRQHHLPASPAVLEGLSTLAARHAEPELCDHLYAHDGEVMLISWCDVFDLPLIISEAVDIGNVETFCRVMGVRYEPWQAG